MSLDPRKAAPAGAELLAYCVRTCGSVARGLERYNRGHCRKPGAFSRRVLEFADVLRERRSPRS